MLRRIRSVLARPRAYQLFFNVIGGPERSRILVREYIRRQPGNRILEIGCGPGTIVPFLPESEYLGFDASPEYIELARKRFPKAKFVCERVSQYTLPHREYFDIVLALGIVHHLDDSEALQLFQIAHTALKQGGKIGWRVSRRLGDIHQIHIFEKGNFAGGLLDHHAYFMATGRGHPPTEKNPAIGSPRQRIGVSQVDVEVFLQGN